MPAARASVFTVIEPLTAVLLAAAVFGERQTFSPYLGIVLIIGVAVLNAVNKRPKALSAAQAT